MTKTKENDNKEIVTKRRRSRYEILHSIFTPVMEVKDIFKDNVEVVDANGNINTIERDFSTIEDYRDYSIENLSETNPAMLDPSNYCTLSGGTSIERADKVGNYMEKVYGKEVELSSLEYVNSIDNTDTTNNIENKE